MLPYLIFLHRCFLSVKMKNLQKRIYKSPKPLYNNYVNYVKQTHAKGVHYVNLK